MQHPNVIGIVRYSVVTKSGLKNWAATRGGSVERALLAVYNDIRMESRSILFKAVTLKYLKYAVRSSARLLICIMTSPCMPHKWRMDLEESVAGYEGIKILDVQMNSGIDATVASYVASLNYAAKDPILTFRLDDDDCLHCSFGETVQKMVSFQNIGKVIAFPEGLYACLSEPDRLGISTIKYRSNAFGISYVSIASNFKTIFSLGSHVKLETVAQFLTCEKPNAWLRSMHGFADTASRRKQQVLYTSYGADSAASLLGYDYHYLDLSEVIEAYRFVSCRQLYIPTP